MVVFVIMKGALLLLNTFINTIIKFFTITNIIIITNIITTLSEIKGGEGGGSSGGGRGAGSGLVGAQVRGPCGLLDVKTFCRQSRIS